MKAANDSILASLLKMKADEYDELPPLFTAEVRHTNLRGSVHGFDWDGSPFNNNLII
jgi:hypothetical protein